ncbi:hypothetical protein HZA87_03980 [Candidatus Uhrbacteria bacterium]|nr:hypothetical protein [Candidatus Uhrbacteria bacterium]
MLLTRLLRKTKKNEPRSERTRWVMFIMIAILASTVILKLIDATVTPERSLLTLSPGLTHLSTLEQLAASSSLTITPPAQTFDAVLYTVGIYNETNMIFPTGTISLVYVKDAWRAFEIDYLPNRTLQDERAILSFYPQENVSLSETTSATVVTRDDSPRCIDYDDGLPNKCEITHQLVFEKNGLLISLSSDGDHATVGELIAIAKSILNQKTTE